MKKQKTKNQPSAWMIKSFVTLATVAMFGTAVLGATPARAMPGTGRVHVVVAPAPLSAPLQGLQQWEPQLQQWCNDVSALLNEGLMAAEAQIRQEDYAGASQSLSFALQQAKDSIDFGGGARHPITRTLIDRGLLVSRAIGSLLGQDSASQLTLVKFMYDFVRFTSQSATELDRSYYIPYYYHCGGHAMGCEDFDLMAFQRQFVEFGRLQLQFVVEHLTINNGSWTYPAGDPRAFFKAAQLFSGFVADDISASLEAYTRACSVNALRRFSMRAGQALANPTHPYPYPSLPIAVQSMARELLDLSYSLSDESCFR